MASPTKLSHVVLQTNRRKEMRDWYCMVLNAQVLHENDVIGFISYDDEHHRVAFIDPKVPLADKIPNEGKTARAGNEAGLHHMAFTYAGLHDLAENYQRLNAMGVRPHRCVNHGVTTSMYYYDPDRNQVELLVDNFADMTDAQAYMRHRSPADKNPVGVDFDPDELVERIRKGLRVEELVAIN